MKIPEARERAESESLDMLVDLGRVCLSRRRMHAAGGSKSCDVEEVEEVVLLFDAAAAAVDLLLLAGATALEDSTAVKFLAAAVIIVASAAIAEAAVDCCSVVEEEGAAEAEAAVVVVSMVVLFLRDAGFFHGAEKGFQIGLRKDFSSRRKASSGTTNWDDTGLAYHLWFLQRIRPHCWPVAASYSNGVKPSRLKVMKSLHLLRKQNSVV